MGFDHSTIVRWIQRVPSDRRIKIIPTLSSRPHHHPNEISFDIVCRILELRKERDQCAEILHYRLKEQGVNVSLSSVKRTLQRHELSRFSKWKKWHQYPPRPMPEKPGILVEIDTIHDGDPKERLGMYTLLDVCSRWAHAIPTIGMNTWKSLKFVEKTQIISPFSFQTLQSDHGSEFSKWFTKRIIERGMAHRHSRIRTPNDNAHLERFNRTIQDECIARIPRSLFIWRKEIPNYLRYYNEERPHMGLNMKTPEEIIKMVQSY
jgi:transposase InsO family protein